jgi:outer membrane lipoprotein SlyB
VTIAAISVAVLALSVLAASEWHLVGASAATGKPATTANPPQASTASASPAANAASADMYAQGAATTATSAASTAVAPATAAMPLPAPVPARPAMCSDCGTVESIHAIQHSGQGSGLGAIAGGLLGAVVGNQFGHNNGRAAMTVLGAGGGAYVGNEIEKDSKRVTTYQVRVRLDRGKTRELYQRDLPSVHVGEHVRIIDGRAVAAR